MTQPKGKAFVNETVRLDGETFDNCTFTNCTLTFSGGALPNINNCVFRSPMSWNFDGAASNTLTFLQMLTSLSYEGAIAFEKALDVIGVSSLPPGDEVQVPFDHLKIHTQHAIAIGQILAAATVLEFQLCNLFAWMLQCPPLHAAAAFYALQTNKARTDMLRELLPHLHSEDERNEVVRILEKATASFATRNKYSHALWQRSGERLYMTQSLETRYPRGVKQLVKLKTILSDLSAVESSVSEISEIITRLTVARALSFSYKAMKPSYVPKFLAQASRRAQSGDFTPLTKSEERELPPESSEE